MEGSTLYIPIELRGYTASGTKCSDDFGEFLLVCNGNSKLTLDRGTYLVAVHPPLAQETTISIVTKEGTVSRTIKPQQYVSGMWSFIVEGLESVSVSSAGSPTLLISPVEEVPFLTVHGRLVNPEPISCTNSPVSFCLSSTTFALEFTPDKSEKTVGFQTTGAGFLFLGLYFWLPSAPNPPSVFLCDKSGECFEIARTELGVGTTSAVLPIVRELDVKVKVPLTENITSGNGIFSFDPIVSYST